MPTRAEGVLSRMDGMIKKCIDCEEVKDIQEFKLFKKIRYTKKGENRRTTYRGRRCIECQRIYDKNKRGGKFADGKLNEWYPGQDMPESCKLFFTGIATHAPEV